jgi:hypothetical protein
LIHSLVTTLGGSKERTVFFPVPGIEDDHCRILKTDSGFVILDNQSKTVRLARDGAPLPLPPLRALSPLPLTPTLTPQGTFLNGIRVLPPTGAILFPGARISFGPQSPDAYLDVLVDPKLDKGSQLDWQVSTLI